MNLSLFGSMALNSLRIEKGFKVYADLDYSHYLDSGIEPFISKKKKIGEEYYKEISTNKVSTMFNIHAEDGWEWSIQGDSPILVDRNDKKKVIGYITTSAKGAETNKTYGIGFIDRDYINNTDCYIDCYGFNWKIDILKNPPLKIKL